MMHALIAERMGEAFARKVSDWFLHTDIRPPGGPQRASLIERYGVHSRELVTALEVMESRWPSRPRVARWRNAPAFRCASSTGCFAGR